MTWPALSSARSAAAGARREAGLRRPNHGVGHQSAPSHLTRGVDRRPPDPGHAGRRLNGAARVVEEGPAGGPRAAAVAPRTSGLVEVETTAPEAAKTLGMTRDDVFPERDGPRTRVDRWGSAHAHPPAPAPR